MRVNLRSLLLAAAVPAAAIAAAGCGGGGGDDVDVGPAAAVPADTPVYLEATVRPQGEAKTDADAALAKILDTDDPGAKLTSLVEKAAKSDLKPGETFTVAQDLDPWLGEKAGVFFSSFEEDADGAVVIESNDNEAALTSLRKDQKVTGQTGEYKGHTYDMESDGMVFGAVGDFIVSGPEDAFEQAVDASEGDALGDSDDFRDSVDDLPDNSLGALYTVPKNILDAIPADAFGPGGNEFLDRLPSDSLEEPVTGDLTASAAAIGLEVTAAGGGGEVSESSLVGEVPADAWLALGVGDLGDVGGQVLSQLESADIPGLEQGISQVESATGASIDELEAALGDSALYVQGTTENALAGALVIHSNDTELTGRLLGQLQSLLQAGSTGGDYKLRGLSLPGGGEGFQVRSADLPRPVEIGQQADKLVIGYGPGSVAATLSPAEPLSSSAAFAAAQKVSPGSAFFLDFAPVFQLAESEGANSDPDYTQAKPYLDALDYLVAGSGTEDDKTQFKLTLGLK